MDSKKRESMEDYLLDQKEISAKDEVKLKTHSEHHTKKHMDMMTKLMKEGKSFDEAHDAAKAEIGG